MVIRLILGSGGSITNRSQKSLSAGETAGEVDSRLALSGVLLVTRRLLMSYTASVVEHTGNYTSYVQTNLPFVGICMCMYV